MRSKEVVAVFSEMAQAVYDALTNESGVSDYSGGLPYASDLYFHDFNFLKNVEDPFLWTFGLGYKRGEYMQGSYVATVRALKDVIHLHRFGWQDLRRLYVWTPQRQFLDISDDAARWRDYLGLGPYQDQDGFYTEEVVNELVKQLPEFYSRLRGGK